MLHNLHQHAIRSRWNLSPLFFFKETLKCQLFVFIAYIHIFLFIWETLPISAYHPLNSLGNLQISQKKYNVIDKLWEKSAMTGKYW